MWQPIAVFEILRAESLHERADSYRKRVDALHLFRFRVSILSLSIINLLSHILYVHSSMCEIKCKEQIKKQMNIYILKNKFTNSRKLPNRKKSHLKDGDIFLAQEARNLDKLDKYTFSNAMAQSVKLGIWEASLNRYVNSIEFVTEDLKAGRKLQMTQQEVLRKQGELFALKHRINLSSDLLDTPDFYWERDDLENLYQQICGYFSIAKRTRVSIV